MATHSLIHGADLINYLRSVRQYDEADKLDPKGVNVVVLSMAQENGTIRALLFCKLNGSNEPVEGRYDFPIKTYMSITQRYVTDDKNDASIN